MAHRPGHASANPGRAHPPEARHWAIVALMAAATLGGCASPHGSDPARSTTSGGDAGTRSPTGGSKPTGALSGRVLAGPICPVEKIASPCPDHPVAGAAVVATPAGTGASPGSAIQTTSAADGSFTLTLPAGDYLITVSLSHPRCPARTIRVQAGHSTQQDITCDTGIR
jgi:hypothetical protein